MCGKPQNEYVVYKGDDVVCAGTAKEIQEKLNISQATFRYMASSHTFEIEKKNRNRMIAISVPISEITG